MPYVLHQICNIISFAKKNAASFGILLIFCNSIMWNCLLSIICSSSKSKFIESLRAKVKAKLVKQTYIYFTQKQRHIKDT